MVKFSFISNYKIICCSWCYCVLKNPLVLLELNLLFYFSIEGVRQHLESYFLKSRQLIKDDRNLCLLCIQCFEVKNYIFTLSYIYKKNYFII